MRNIIMGQVFTALGILAALFSSVAIGQDADENTVLRYVTDDYLAGAIFRPARVLEGRFVTTALDGIGDKALLDEPFEEFRKGVGLNIREVDEIGIFLDRKTIYSMARIPDPGNEAVEDPVVSARELRNQFKQILLAAHNYHDTYRCFPDNDGGRDDNKGNLSWRVHLLPFIDGGAALYERFHLDEKWDSEHNKTLIDEMPDVFLTPGVKEKGKTSIHGVVGENMVMSGEQAIRIRDITDGTSNTIMIVEAGPDKADTWTKPGGIKYQEGPPSVTLGKVGKTFTIGMCDGSARAVPGDLDADTFSRLLTYNGGEVVGDLSAQEKSIERRLPTWVVKNRKKINRDAIFMSLRPMGDPIEVKSGSITTYTFGDYILAFPDDKTLVAAPADLLPILLKNTKPAGELGKELSAGLADNDAVIAIDFTHLQPFKDRIARQIPLGGEIVKGVEYLQLSADISGKQQLIHDIAITTESEATAGQLSLMAQGLIQVQKGQLMLMSNQNTDPVPSDVFVKLLELYEGVEIKPDGKVVHYTMKKPEDMDAFVDGLKPIFEAISEPILQERDRAKASLKRRSMKQIGLAFHNYHDVYRSFPRFNGDANPDEDEAKTGLSWRVHLLPFLDEAELYQKFAMDEPWDSDTNKPLIEQMPEVYRTRGTDKEGHTSIHTFIGDETTFGDGSEAPALRTILDGTSNTILAVEAGSDTADIWTKPGGLKFTGKDSIKLLGNVNEEFLVLMCDGFVRFVRKDIDEDVFNNLIRHDDGNVVGEF